MTMAAPGARRVVLAAPGDPAARTGGHLYNARIGEALRRRGWHVEPCRLDAGFPRPTAQALATAASRFAALPDGALVLVDSLALGAMPEVVCHERHRLRLAALVHLPLAADPGLGPERVAPVREAEARALAAVRAVIVTGEATRAWLAPYGEAAQRAVVVEPGVGRRGAAIGSGDPAVVHLVCVAAVTAGKGHDRLLRALASMPRGGWRLTCAGSLARDAAFASEVRALAETLRLAAQVTWAGELDDAGIDGLYRHADASVLATRRETYGMAVAEALACGLPVVATDTGAIAALVGTTAGCVVPVDDDLALSAALATLIGDGEARARWRDGARAASATLPTWDAGAARLAKVLEEMERDDVG